jgi:(E)-4-hydroxy-3-methylbut-2-enyl-diphosphate synthase
VAPATRRPTPTVRIGGVRVGSAHPIVIQSMTNTDTADAEATADQIAALVDAGSEIVRITVNTRAAARAVGEIAARLANRGVRAPLVGDFHFNGHVLLTEFPKCAAVLAKYRINPGNVGVGDRRDENFSAMIRVAVEHGKPVRIGVNGGSLDGELLAHLMDKNARAAKPEPASAVTTRAMIESAVRSASAAESLGLPHDRIVLSAKMSGVQELVAVTRGLARATDLPLHLGLTEAGPGAAASAATVSALAILLQEGIGDTLRASLTPAPGGDRAEEVRLCRHVLQALGLRRFTPRVTACPGCGRTTSTLFQELAARVEERLTERMREWSECYPGAADLRVAVMGCVVNGPGESKHAHVGISLPGTGEDPKAPVFIDGRPGPTLQGEGIADDFLRIVEEYVARKYAGEEASCRSTAPEN